jgi:Cys-tRNA(Pro)/Cys-tRNA(Cys) deacylase
MTNSPLADSGPERMLAAAVARGLAVEVRERPAAASLDEAAALLGVRPADIAKTIVVRRAPAEYLFVLVPGDTQIGWPKLRAVIGVNKLKFPDAAEALAATGYERGAITPIGSEPDWPVYVDRRLVGCRVAMGAGAHGYSAFVEVDDLVRAYQATVADLTD